MAKIVWNDVGIQGECADKILELVNEWWKDEEVANEEEVQNELVAFYLEDVCALCNEFEWQEFFEELEKVNCGVIYDEKDTICDGVARLLIQYIGVEK